MSKAIITVVGKDQVGIIAKVCTYLAEKEINIYDYIDKLHKIKITFTKDDTNEYHFESFEIID